MSRLPFADLESHLLQHVPDSSAAGPIRQVAGRTRDVIDAVAHIAQFHGRRLPADWNSAATSVQLELGLPREMTEVGQRLGNLLSRGQYLSLMRAGITTVNALRADTPRLESMVGPDGSARILTALTDG
jgi:hypothetical protein